MPLLQAPGPPRRPRSLTPTWLATGLVALALGVGQALGGPSLEKRLAALRAKHVASAGPREWLKRGGSEHDKRVMGMTSRSVEKEWGPFRWVAVTDLQVGDRVVLGQVGGRYKATVREVAGFQAGVPVYRWGDDKLQPIAKSPVYSSSKTHAVLPPYAREVPEALQEALGGATLAVARLGVVPGRTAGRRPADTGPIATNRDLYYQSILEKNPEQGSLSPLDGVPWGTWVRFDQIRPMDLIRVDGEDRVVHATSRDDHYRLPHRREESPLLAFPFTKRNAWHLWLYPGPYERASGGAKAWMAYTPVDLFGDRRRVPAESFRLSRRDGDWGYYAYRVPLEATDAAAIAVGTAAYKARAQAQLTASQARADAAEAKRLAAAAQKEARIRAHRAECARLGHAWQFCDGSGHGYRDPPNVGRPVRPSRPSPGYDSTSDAAYYDRVRSYKQRNRNGAKLDWDTNGNLR